MAHFRLQFKQLDLVYVEQTQVKKQWVVHFCCSTYVDRPVLLTFDPFGFLRRCKHISAGYMASRPHGVGRTENELWLDLHFQRSLSQSAPGCTLTEHLISRDLELQWNKFSVDIHLVLRKEKPPDPVHDRPFGWPNRKIEIAAI